ncbi:AglZ/HisF2 family acetamidino modification protein [Rhizorhabdus sp.]|uniref:AglZ/HisF2 family acetamidino modification protein n=1 Tax=Rhizorhabdus sp. TaxID=1968843 RepID=UPI001985F663|nr:AglZ/HisF2 family acetamidino modification protein [Rhizorhabdus sp.]MBD3760741.1 imidazole glycerol phosphate synthase subunit HisF [Rhizorhabdus sp.]
MLRPRVIPCLLLEDGDLIKTVRFERDKYIGDPINAVRIYNEKEVDELVVLDINASRDGREPDFALIGKLAAECRMPLCYGGGISTPAQVERLVSLGVEKVATSSAALADPGLIRRAADMVGSQSVVAVLDVAKRKHGYEVVTLRGTRPTGLDPVEAARRMQGAGAGEIVINAIDRDGTMAGYDLDLARLVHQAIDIPMTFLGGAGSVDHIGDLVGTLGVVGAGAGSLFVFKGVYRAVLINYPSVAVKAAIYNKIDNHS